MILINHSRGCLHCDGLALFLLPGGHKRQPESHLLFMTLYNVKDATKGSERPKCYSEVRVCCGAIRQREYETQTFPTFLDTSQDGGSKPGCLRDQRQCVVGVTHIAAPWLIHAGNRWKNHLNFRVTCRLHLNAKCIKCKQKKKKETIRCRRDGERCVIVHLPLHAVYHADSLVKGHLARW